MKIVSLEKLFYPVFVPNIKTADSELSHHHVSRYLIS